MLSYLGLGVLAAVVLGALVTLGIGARFADGAGTVVCRTVHSGTSCGTPAKAPARATATGTGDDRRDHRAKPSKPSKPSKKGGCHGLWGCTWSGTKNVAGGAWGGMKDTGGGIKTLVTTNPVTTGKSVGTYLWKRSPIPEGIRAWKSCGAGQVYDCADSVNCLVTANACLVRDMFFDDKTRDDIAKGHWGDATGRVLWNTGSMLLPTKVTGLKGFGTAGKAADDAGDAAKVPHSGAPLGHGGDSTLSLGKAEKDLRGVRRARGAAEHLNLAQVRKIAADFRRLGPAERTEFLDQIALSEMADIWKTAPEIDANLHADLMQAASPRMLQFLDARPPFANSGGWYTFDGDLWRDSGPTRWDVQQGDIGTCWCLASMGAVADQGPELLKQMFTKNANGTYTIAFGDGVRVTVTPELPYGGAHVYREAGWPALLEKAIATRRGGYDAIHGGDPGFALNWLTGKSVTQYIAEDHNMPSAQTIATNLGRHDAYVLTLGKDVTFPDMADRGIFANHSYTVIDADPAAKTVTLANPHGPTSPEITLTEDDLKKDGMYLVKVPTR